ncbi:heme ABC exporter ATP-binding protein CcmA [Pseudooceanicola sp. 200-1SW]|uniref:heme ABC exporter ATP-binding protein CcmA n=1 Tax=Pseudooceanicola sp. 200-1SW TaxID=3425949 RepID=UPI003D7FA6A2
MEMKVTDLAVARGGVPLLAGVSFTLAPGRALILRGPNGSGKTTLLRVLAGLQPPQGGTMSFDREAVAYGAHADGLKAQMSVVENLTFWAAVHGLRDIAPALAAFDLEGLGDRLAGTLSAGQKRRLGLARLMVTGRPLWLLDEPTVSLDAASVTLFAEAVRGHLARGGMAVIATHIDLGLPEAEVLDVGPLKAALPLGGLDEFDEAFL